MSQFAPLAPYFAAHWGSPPMIQSPAVRGDDPSIAGIGYQLGATDPDEALELGAAYADEVGRGFHPFQAVKNAMARHRQRRQARMMQQFNPGGGYGPPCGCRPSYGRPGFGGDFIEGFGADDDDDPDEIAADEEEVAALEADDEQVGSDDVPQELGATVRTLERKMGRIDDKIMKLEAKLEATPAWKPKRRQRIKMHLARLRRAKSKKAARLEFKQSKLEAKMGLPSGALAAAGGGVAATAAAAAALGMRPSDIGVTERMMARAQAMNALGIDGRYEALPGEGEQVSVPFLFSGSEVLEITVPAGAAADYVISGQTGAIPFASFEVVGLMVELSANVPRDALTGFPMAEQLITTRIQSFGVFGDKNLLYGTQSINFAAQNAALMGRRVITGLRDNPALDKTNYCTLNGIFTQHLTTTVDYGAVLQAAAICRRRSDPAAERF